MTEGRRKTPEGSEHKADPIVEQGDARKMVKGLHVRRGLRHCRNHPIHGFLQSCEGGCVGSLLPEHIATNAAA